MISTLLALLLGVQLLLPQLFDQALSASREGRFAEALPLWTQVLEVAPNDAAAWSNRGNVLLALGDPRAAIADQTKAIALDSESPDPHLNRGTAEEALGRLPLDPGAGPQRHGRTAGLSPLQPRQRAGLPGRLAGSAPLL